MTKEKTMKTTRNKDYLGNVINIGDVVVFMETKYRNLMKGTVISLTPKTALIDHKQLMNKNTKSETSPLP